jgi:hypothetical protein
MELRALLGGAILWGMVAVPPQFTPQKVLGAPHYTWRVIRGGSDRQRVERRAIPHGIWRNVPAEEWGKDLTRDTEVGAWLTRLRNAGLLK